MLLVRARPGPPACALCGARKLTPVALTVLYLDPVTKQLQAYDDITLGGVGANDARISRHVVAEPQPGPAPVEAGPWPAQRPDTGARPPTPPTTGPTPPASRGRGPA